MCKEHIGIKYLYYLITLWFGVSSNWLFTYRNKLYHLSNKEFSALQRNVYTITCPKQCLMVNLLRKLLKWVCMRQSGIVGVCGRVIFFITMSQAETRCKWLKLTYPSNKEYNIPSSITPRIMTQRYKYNLQIILPWMLILIMVLFTDMIYM